MSFATPEHIGPFQILDALGRGGMGTVYRARHRESGALVALKTVRMASPYVLHGLRREIAALARLDHPGVVRVVADGLHDGLPWYAMELLSGKSLRQYLSGRRGAHPEEPSGPEVRTVASTDATAVLSAPDVATERLGHESRGVPATFVPAVELSDAARTEALTIACTLCDTLAYLHGEGIVHRDLKPENVVVLSDGRPVLVDFGLAVAASVGREALEVSWETAGTVWYMAPEQGRAELVDARADIYAIGCLLYELLAGQPPFVGESVPLVLVKHQTEEPPPLAGRVTGVSPELEALVRRLLAKDPRDRLGHAEDVAAALERLGAHRERGRPVPRPFLYRPGLCGRDDALAAVRRRIQELHRGRGGLVVITGDAGVGKTRFAMEASQLALRDGVVVLSSACATADRAPLPLQGFRPLLQYVADICRQRGPEAAGRIAGDAARIFEIYEPAFGTLVAAPGPRPELSAAEARRRLVAGLAATLRELLSSEPLLLVLDDLHRADALTQDVLRDLAAGGHLATLPFLVVATALYAAESPELASLLSLPAAGRVHLPLLPPADVARLTADMLAMHPVPKELVRVLSEHAEGNPFLVSESLRVALEEGLLRRDGVGGWWADVKRIEDLPLASSVRDVVLRRLGSLSSEAAAVLATAAVYGDPLDTDVVLGACGLPDREALAGLADLVARQVLEPVKEGYRFLHRKVRRAAYERLAPVERTRVHGALATALGELRGGSGDHAAALAWHCHRAGRLPEAAVHYLAAADRAEAAYDLALAEKMFRAYLGLPEVDLARRSVARRQLAGVVATRGRPEAAAEELARSLEDAERVGDETLAAKAMGDLANLECARGNLARSLDLADRTVARARAAGARGCEARALMLGATLRSGTEAPGRVRELYEAAIDALVAIGDHRGEGSGRTHLANFLNEQGDRDAARPLFEQAIACFERAGDIRHGAGARANLAAMAFMEERYEEALRIFDGCLQDFRRVGDRAGEGGILVNIGLCHHELARHDEALAAYEAGIALESSAGHPEGHAHGLLFLATLLVQSGRWDDGAEAARKALAMAERMGNQRLCGMAHGTLARVSLARGEADEAASLLEKSVSEAPPYERAYCLRELAGARIALGDTAAAEACLTEAEASPAFETAASLRVSVRRLQALLQRLSRGDVRRASALLALARSESLGRNDTERVLLACEAGLLALAEGADAAPMLAEAEAALPLAVDVSGARRELQRLRASMEAMARGEALWRGTALSELPPAIRAIADASSPC